MKGGWLGAKSSFGFISFFAGRKMRIHSHSINFICQNRVSNLFNLPTPLSTLSINELNDTNLQIYSRYVFQPGALQTM